MRTRLVAIALLAGATSSTVLAQDTLDWPLPAPAVFHVDSGLRANLAPTPQTVFADVIGQKGVVGLRIYFGDVSLDRGSFVRVTSLLDGEVQELNARNLVQWNNSTAYFNGEIVLVELVAAPGSVQNRLVIDRVGVQPDEGLAVGSCGICGNDDRVPSNEDWTGRMLPAGCTASVYNSDSCMVSAGHCVSGGDVISFRVPPSTNGCNIVNPPIAEQFPITGAQFVNGGVGNDWAVMTSGTNNLGETAFERYGVFRPIAGAPPVAGQAVSVTGYGIDSQCTLSQTQQFNAATIASVSGTWFEHFVDATFGNSGSAVIRNDEIIGIVTHCPCPGAATRIDHPSFAAAREALCPGGASEEAPLLNFNVRRGILLSGDLSSLQESDDVPLRIDAVLSGNGNRYVVMTIVNAVSPSTTVAQLDLTTEIGVDVAANSMKTKVWLRNWTAGGWDIIDNYSQGTSDTERVTLDIPNPNDYIRDNNNRIRVRIQTSARVNHAPDGFVARIDHVQVDVTQ